MIPVRKRNSSITSLGSFVQHEVDFSCSVCARHRDSFLEFEKREKREKQQVITDETLITAHHNNTSNDYGLMLSGFTGISTSEVSAVLNVSDEDDDNRLKLVEDFLKEEKKEEVEKIRLTNIASALNERIMREKFIIDAIQIAKNADARRPSKSSVLKMKNESLLLEEETNALIIRSIPLQRKRLNDKKGREGKKEDDLMKLTVIEIDERLEALRQEEVRIQERILRKKGV
jgi:hypothetical protein